MRKPWVLLLLVGSLAVICLGVIYGVTRPLYQEQPSGTNAPASSSIESASIGELADAAQATSQNPSIKTFGSYNPGDQLVLRATTASGVKSPVQVTVRLLDDAGRITQLNPSSVTFQPGTSGHCCWQVEEQGSYTFQIFRPEGGIISLPLKIQ